MLRHATLSIRLTQFFYFLISKLHQLFYLSAVLALTHSVKWLVQSVAAEVLTEYIKIIHIECHITMSKL